MTDDLALVPIAWIRILTGVFVLVLAGGGGAWWLGVREGEAREHRKAYELERRARIDSIRVADLVKDSTARQLHEAARVRDSAAAAQRVKRAAFRIVSDTTVVFVDDTIPRLAPARLITYIRGEDAKVAIDSTWRAKVAADTAAIAEQRDQWKRRAISAEDQIAKERHRFGLKTGIVIGAGSVLLLAKAVAEIVR